MKNKKFLNTTSGKLIIYSVISLLFILCCTFFINWSFDLSELSSNNRLGIVAIFVSCVFCIICLIKMGEAEE